MMNLFEISGSEFCKCWTLVDAVVCHLDPHVKTKAITSPAAVSVADIGVRQFLGNRAALAPLRVFIFCIFFVLFKIQGLVF